MSVWSHVLCSFRFDSFRNDWVLNVKDYTIKDFHNIIGKECLWDSEETVWDDVKNNSDTYLPMGSEGSLRMSLWTNPNKDEIPSYTVTIFGDLRDHDDKKYVDDMIKWFIDKCNEIEDDKDNNLSIRQAFIQIDNEAFGLKSISNIDSIFIDEEGNEYA